ncbi:hypothetical protein MOK15_01270 [Sphingobium sp. BYY-5]|uniref:hypothetical protein n=1 Tax=Sphingobium sp. BYY-5 TaxID=2926400 RepID=UPI001FA74928|nr:hypothetical protein [Sphingobium sp. BYY-5]MCI4588738.1 hypothetical protein [Sphingobium sp. BYY-5]
MRSTSSWTIPQPTDVLSYSYLWEREAAQGRDEGVKDRPVVVVLAAVTEGDLLQVYVAPVTTQPPREASGFVEMPMAVKRHLGLDDARCWIVASEVNRFIWPGPDVRPVQGGDGSPYYGKIPGKLLEQVRAVMREGRIRITPRTE